MSQSDQTIEGNRAAVRAQLRRILASTEFVNSARMSRFLELAVEETLAGRAERLKEYTVAVEVFDRPDSFDSGSDPIVRVEARRLRSKLQKYYSTAGRHDTLIIELPKGRYSPEFRPRLSRDSEAPPRVCKLAVLPFANLTPGQEANHFGEGLAWELIHRLTQIEELEVVAWNSAAQFGSGPADIAAAARKLDVRWMVTGSVRLQQPRVRVMVQLVDAGKGVYKWSETYDRAAADVLTIQEDIAASVTAALRLRLGGAAPQRPRTYNLEAYRLYLRGRMEWNQRTEGALRQSIATFEQAARLDPELAHAHAGIADALTILAGYGLDAPAETLPRAEAAARHALSIDPSLAEAHCSLGFLLIAGSWDWNAAEVHYRRALELNPGYATAHHWFGENLLALRGQFEEALDEISIACRLDPLSPIIEQDRGYVLFLARRFEDARDCLAELCRKHPEFYKGHTALGRVLLHLHEYERAVTHLEYGYAAAGEVPSILSVLGQAYALTGRTEAAKAILARLTAMAASRHVPRTALALLHLVLGERERALDRLDEAAARRDIPMLAIGVHAAYDPLRGDPRFESLLRQLRLAP